MSQFRTLLAAVVAAGLAGSAAARADVVVSSKLDTEATLLGTMIKLMLDANGIKTKDRLTLGGTPVVRKAITSGEIAFIGGLASQAIATPSSRFSSLTVPSPSACGYA